MMFKRIDEQPHATQREAKINEFWAQNDVFARSIQQRQGGENFSFYDGPPTANGKPHIGHVLTRTFKDVVPRYRTMKGARVDRIAGWDTHGLPVELEVEKALGISGKPQIEQYGLEPFIQKCKQSVWTYKGQWEEMSRNVAYWADMEHPYITYDNNYIESVWWSLASLFDRGLMYRGHKVVPYCPRCGTALSSHEVAQGYKDVKEVSAVVKFPTQDPNTFFLAWTTTPWTLPSNSSLCVNPDADYAFASYQGQTIILAAALAQKVLGEDVVVQRVCKGSELAGREYLPLYPQARAMADGKKCFVVVADNYVTLNDGTGIVHQAPYGEDDVRVARDNGVALLPLADTTGHFGEEIPLLTGLFIKQADPVVLEDLRERGLLFDAPAYEHSYPFCWRCDTPLMYYPRESWFIRVTEVKEALIRNSKGVNWMPENIRDGRMGNFLENVVDWAISRERYWGTPLPLWVCGCGHMRAVGSIEQLKAESPDCPDDIELHRPYIDAVHLTCGECGGQMTRVPEVIDCWYDSGAMPFAQWHFPFENKENFERNFPADYICEAIDQTRGWFYSLLAIGTLMFDCAPYRNCLVLGHVNDKDGIKMSKHIGNVVTPDSVIDVVGADAVRWYFFTTSMPWLPTRFSADIVGEAKRKMMGTLENTLAFFLLYADIDGFDPAKHPVDEAARTVADRDILARLHALTAQVDTWMAEYKITESARAIGEFIDTLSNWYVRTNRGRFWGEGVSADKAAAYHTLMEALHTLSLLLAPFVPFLAEDIYQHIGRKLGGPESVHLCDFPAANPARIDAALVDMMDKVQEVVGVARAARSAAGLKVRQPLAQLLICGGDIPAEGLGIIAEELNVKQAVLVDDSAGLMTYTFKPQLRTLGRKYGALVPAIGAYLAQADGDAGMATVKDGAWRFEIEGQLVELQKEDLLVTQVPRQGYALQSEGGWTVALDTTLTDELVAEGYLREVISKVQNQRKEQGLKVTDRVRLTIEAPAELAGILGGVQEQLAAAVLAREVAFAANEGREWDVNGQVVKIAIEVVG